jgi:ribose transport system permease protein
LFLVVILYAIVAFVMKRMTFGRILYGMGANKYAVELSGINTRKYSIMVFTTTGFICALASIVMAGRIVSGSPTAGQGLEMDAIAASVLGGIAISGGIGNVLGTIIGVFIIMFIQNGLILMKISAYWQIIAKGIVIIAAVGISNLSIIRRKI